MCALVHITIDQIVYVLSILHAWRKHTDTGFGPRFVRCAKCAVYAVLWHSPWTFSAASKTIDFTLFRKGLPRKFFGKRIYAFALFACVCRKQKKTRPELDPNFWMSHIHRPHMYTGVFCAHRIFRMSLFDRWQWSSVRPLARASATETRSPSLALVRNRFASHWITPGVYRTYSRGVETMTPRRDLIVNLTGRRARENNLITLIEPLYFWRHFHFFPPTSAPSPYTLCAYAFKICVRASGMCGRVYAATSFDLPFKNIWHNTQVARAHTYTVVRRPLAKSKPNRPVFFSPQIQRQTAVINSCLSLFLRRRTRNLHFLSCHG